MADSDSFTKPKPILIVTYIVSLRSLQELPEQVGASEEKDPPPMPSHGKLSDDELKIAWRYSNMPKNQVGFV